VIKIYSLLIFLVIVFLLDRIKKKKYPEFGKQEKSIWVTLIMPVLLGSLFGLAMALKMALYPDFDPNFDLMLIAYMLIVLIVTEIRDNIDYIRRKGYQRKV